MDAARALRTAHDSGGLGARTAFDFRPPAFVPCIQSDSITTSPTIASISMRCAIRSSTVLWWRLALRVTILSVGKDGEDSGFNPGRVCHKENGRSLGEIPVKPRPKEEEETNCAAGAVRTCG